MFVYVATEIIYISQGSVLFLSGTFGEARGTLGRGRLLLLTLHASCSTSTLISQGSRQKKEKFLLKNLLSCFFMKLYSFMEQTATIFVSGTIQQLFLCKKKKLENFT